jgi:hypothetical protein
MKRSLSKALYSFKLKCFRLSKSFVINGSGGGSDEMVD